MSKSLPARPPINTSTPSVASSSGCGRVKWSISIATAETSDITYLATMISGTFEIQHMQRALEIFKVWPDYEDRVRTIFTRVEPCDANEQAKLAQSLGYSKVSIIPNEYMLPIMGRWRFWKSRIPSSPVLLIGWQMRL